MSSKIRYTLLKDVIAAVEPKVIDCPYRNMKVIFVVTKIMFYEDGSIGLAWGCSYAEDCDVPFCRYSRAWKRVRGEKR